MVTIGDKLRIARKQKDITLVELSQSSGLSQAYLSGIENNKKNPTLNTIYQLANALNISPAFLFNSTTEIAETEDNSIKSEVVSFFGERVKALRKEKGLTQEELADLVNLSKSAVSNWEQGTRFPDQKALVLIANIFNVSLDHLVGRQEDSITANITSIFSEEFLPYLKIAIALYDDKIPIEKVTKIIELLRE